MIHTFIYGLSDPNTNIIRYVGKSNNPNTRLYAHLKEAQTSNIRNHKNNWIKSLINNGQRPVIIILEVCLMSIWQEREVYYIKLHNGPHLLNVKPGGQGESTMSCSKERAAKISAALKGRKQSSKSIEKTRLKNTGKVRTAEAKKRYSESKLGANNPNFGKSMSSKTREALNASVVGVPKTDEHKKKIASARSKAVVCFTLDGKYMDTYSSAKIAAEILQISRTSISACLSGRLKNAGGFLWKYANGIEQS